MAAQAQPVTTPDSGGAPERARELPTLELLALLLVAAVFLRPAMASFFDNPALQMWSTVFVSITVQALPFLVLGVVVSGAIAALVPPRWLADHLPKRPILAVPTAGLAGMALPGCECGSVPIAGRLTARGAAPAAAFAFMLSAPAINPVVMVATAVAFPGRPDIVAARFVASLLTAIVVGLLWSKFGNEALLAKVRTEVPQGVSRWEAFSTTVRHDFLHAGGWLVVGGMTAATLQVAVPRSVLDALGGNELLAILLMGGLAVILAICSEADAFVAVGLTQFSLSSRLVFLVVGPVVDLKLIALQAGTFGRAFAVRFAPAAFAVAVLISSAVGAVIL